MRFGLSPHVRGNRAQPVRLPIALGSIPARAGEPGLAFPSAQGSQVYPRTCGGTAKRVAGTVPDSGLSPHVRGNHRRLGLLADHRGSIPARAGEPPSRARKSRLSPVYPRTCGGTSFHSPEAFLERGLSPHVRGNPVDPVNGDILIGSIPARAGEPRTRPQRAQTHRRAPLPAHAHARRRRRNTDRRRSRSRKLVKNKVYPRTCGGTVCHLVLSLSTYGLSPHVRGNPSGGGGLLA